MFSRLPCYFLRRLPLVLSRQSSSYILGIETSCDDTGAAVINSSGELLGDVTRSQLHVHLNNGGVIPPIAKDLHQKNIEDVIIETLDCSGIKVEDVSAIAVTTKPGLPLSLHVGVEFAKRMCFEFEKPLIPIHHMEAHALIGSFFSRSLKCPFLTLLISGGHAQLAIVKDLDTFLLLGLSYDDAPGESLDKVARRLKVRNLGPPFDSISGGAALDILARNGNPEAFFSQQTFVPLQKYRNCDFSFAAFKNFNKLIHNLEQKENVAPDEPLPQLQDIAASLLHTMTLHILQRLARALAFIEITDVFNSNFKNGDNVPQFKSSLEGNIRDAYNTERPPLTIPLVVSGGVACNDYITQSIQVFCQSYEGVYETTRVLPIIPRPKKLCTDNGIMIAWNGYLKWKEGGFVLNKKEDIENISVDPKAPLGICLRDVVEKARIRTYSIKRDVILNRQKFHC